MNYRNALLMSFSAKIDEERQKLKRCFALVNSVYLKGQYIWTFLSHKNNKQILT